MRSPAHRIGPPRRRGAPPRARRVRRFAAALIAAAAGALISACAAGAAPVCGQPILASPYAYDGAAGAYTSGTAGLPTYGSPGSDFPDDTAGVVLPVDGAFYYSYQLSPDTVYYLLPGVHTGAFQADAGDSFVGGLANGTSTVLSGQYALSTAIDSNSTDGDQAGVTIEYLTIEEYAPDVDAAAINQDSNTGWTLRDDTITENAPGAGAFAGAGSTLQDNCMTLNGQYGFQATDADSWGRDALTDGPYDITITGNEITYNDTCDLENRLNNAAIGWSDYDPVPAQYRNPHCGNVTGDGNEGGFKLWHTDGVTITGNDISNNFGPGIWADTDNANTTISGNTISGNDGEAVFEEISYNFAITGNYMAGNDIVEGLGNPGFPQVAVYISESGSDRTFGGVPACPEAACAGQPSYPDTSVVSGNTMVDNGGSVFLWQNSGRYCSDGSDGACTLLDGGPSGPFTVAACQANLPTAAVDTTSYTGETTGTPAEDWWDGCQWKTENVNVTGNTVDFDPSAVMDCNQTDWPDCGADGTFSEYGSPPDDLPGWVIPTSLTFWQHNTWSDNVYDGPSTFFAWNQGNGENPVSWADWTGDLSGGDRCSSAGERQSGYCTGPFGQDAGSTYSATYVQAATPVLSLTAPASATTGSAIAGSSVLSGGNAPTGAITFTVYGPLSSPPSSCASGGTTLGAAAVIGNGTYDPPASFTPPAAGNYYWYAAYGGDDQNDAADSACGTAMAMTAVTDPPAAGTPPPTDTTPPTGTTGTVPPTGTGTGTGTTPTPTPTPDPGAAITARTLPASRITPTSATLHGTVVTDGAAVSWAFQYGRGSAYNKVTPVRTIPAGRSGPVAVAARLTGLRAAARYRYRLVVVAVRGETPVVRTDNGLTVATWRRGQLRLLAGTLTVSGGRAGAPLRCTGAVTCVQHLVLVARPAPRQAATASCGDASVRAAPGHTAQVRLPISARCLAVLRAAPGQHVLAALAGRRTPTERALRRTVTLRLGRPA